MHVIESSHPPISLILPAWNEADVIATAIAEADAALSQITNDYEIIVVDDGSTDETARIVLELAGNDPRVRLVQHTPNQGYGAAIRSGFAAATKSLISFTDADCQFDLNELDRFVLLSSHYDIVCGYRIDRKDSALRCFYSKVYNVLVRLLLGTGVRDVDCALKVFHRDVAKKLRITGNGFLVNSEMLVQARQLGYSICEVGVSHRPRTLGESTVSVQHIPRVLASLARYWWNEVQFGRVDPISSEQVQVQQREGNRPSRGNSPRARPLSILSQAGGSRAVWLQLGLLLIAAIFMLTNLSYPLIDRDETRYAEIPREMMASGNWILPQLNFQTYCDKPPLLYWLCLISFKLFGVSETSARLVPALAALATLASTIFFGSRTFGRQVGLLAGAVLFLSVGFAFTSRYLLLDGVLSLFVSLSLFTAYEAVRQPRLKMGWWIASAICIGLAFLTKGPIALVLWLPPVAVLTWVSEVHAKIRWWNYGLVGVVVTTIALPWFVLVHRQDTTFLLEFVYKHNLARFAGEFHPKPIWFFVPVVLIAGHPWSFLTIPYAKFLLRRDDSARAKRPPAVGYLLLWSGWCFAFFSLSACKLPTYLLPAAPAFALMIAHYLNQVTRDSGNLADSFANFWSARLATATTCLAGVSFVLFAIVWVDITSFSMFGWAMLWAMLLMVSLILMPDRHHANVAWASSAGVAFVFAVMVMHQVIPAYSRSQTLLGDVSPLASPIAMMEHLPIATIAHEFADVPFYLNRSDIHNFADAQDASLAGFISKSGTAVLVVEEQSTADLFDRLPESIKLIEVGRRGPRLIYKANYTIRPTRIATVPRDASERTKP